MRASCQQPWLLLGDYNLIFDATDKNNNNNLNRRMMGRFRRLLDDIELKDIYLNGRRYTWSNERDYSTLDLECLDGAICSVDWEDMYPDCFLQSFATTMSDHCPLLLSTSTSLGSAKRFRFESFWPKMDGFQEAVAEVWDKGQLPSDPMLRLFQNLKLTVKKLQSWSDSKVGNIKLQILLAKEIMLQLGIAQDSRNLSSPEIWLRKKLKRAFAGFSLFGENYC